MKKLIWLLLLGVVISCGEYKNYYTPIMTRTNTCNCLPDSIRDRYVELYFSHVDGSRNSISIDANKVKNNTFNQGNEDYNLLFPYDTVYLLQKVNIADGDTSYWGVMNDPVTNDPLMFCSKQEAIDFLKSFRK